MSKELFKNTGIAFERLNKYEEARILGTRALQLSLDAPSTVDTTGLTDPLKIAMKEMREGRLPIKIKRELPMN